MATEQLAAGIREHREVAGALGSRLADMIVTVWGRFSAPYRSRSWDGVAAGKRVHDRDRYSGRFCGKSVTIMGRRAGRAAHSMIATDIPGDPAVNRSRS
jgi:hypothetical protein